MKKAFAILLVVLLAVAAVFASGNTVTVKSIVGSVSLEQANEEALKNGKSLYELFVRDGQTLASTTTSNTDISIGDVEAEFAIKQNALLRTSEKIELAVTVSQLTFETFSTDALSFSSVGAETTLVEVKFDPATDNSLPLKLQYKGVVTEVPANTLLASFKTTWAKKTALADHPGMYTANITLAYTIE